MQHQQGEVTIGLVIGQVGALTALPTDHDNYFVQPMDQLYCDSATGKAVCEGQKPVALMTELINLYTTPRDWVFSSPSEIGMYIPMQACICLAIHRVATEISAVCKMFYLSNRVLKFYYMVLKFLHHL